MEKSFNILTSSLVVMMTFEDSQPIIAQSCSGQRATPPLFNNKKTGEDVEEKGRQAVKKCCSGLHQTGRYMWEKSIFHISLQLSRDEEQGGT